VIQVSPVASEQQEVQSYGFDEPQDVFAVHFLMTTEHISSRCTTGDG